MKRTATMLDTQRRSSGLPTGDEEVSASFDFDDRAPCGVAAGSSRKVSGSRDDHGMRVVSPDRIHQCAEPRALCPYWWAGRSMSVKMICQGQSFLLGKNPKLLGEYRIDVWLIGRVKPEVAQGKRPQTHGIRRRVDAREVIRTNQEPIRFRFGGVASATCEPITASRASMRATVADSSHSAPYSRSAGMTRIRSAMRGYPAVASIRAGQIRLLA